MSDPASPITEAGDWRDCGGNIYRLHDGGREIAAIWPMVKGGWFIQLQIDGKPEETHERPNEDAARQKVREALHSF